MEQIALYVLLVNVITLCLYARDKSLAQHNKHRISEKTLHLWSLLGGWLGALIGQKWCRHKTQKKPFKYYYWLTIIINIAIVWCAFEAYKYLLM